MSGPGIDYREELARLGESGRDSSKECEGEGWCVSLTAGRSWSAVFGREKKREREERVANNNDKGSNSECWI